MTASFLKLSVIFTLSATPVIHSSCVISFKEPAALNTCTFRSVAKNLMLIFRPTFQLNIFRKQIRRTPYFCKGYDRTKVDVGIS